MSVLGSTAQQTGLGEHRGHAMSIVFEPVCPEIQEACDCGTHGFVGAVCTAVSLRGMRRAIF